MKNSTVALAIMGLLLAAMGLAPAALADGADPGGEGKIYVVKSPEGETLGTARRVLVNPLGTADFVIVSLEQGDYRGKQIIVPLSAMSAVNGESITLDVKKEVLAGAPSYTGAEANDPTFFEDVYRFYGMTPPWTEEQREAY